ncbi:MAG: hypothetical protein GTO17_09170 [Candidatus Aminicenantes bacterium]|nr:hypothetical protein [Candidatus Aminicenantes bacterium]
MKKAIVLMAALFCWFILVGSFASAQEFADLKGVVKDDEGLPLPGVSISLSGTKIAPMTTVTSQKGHFRFVKLPVASDYVLRCELAGFKTYTQEKIVITFNQDVNLNITMELARLEEQVTVVGQTPVIDTKKTQVGINISEEMIMDLPTARNPWVLMELIPGMLVDKSDVGGNESGQQSDYFGHGSDDDDSTWSVDGANITDNSALGAAPAYLNLSSYESLQVNYGNNDVLAQTGGVQINFVTKRGGNRYSGTFYLDVEDNAWQSDNVSDDLKELGYSAAGINRFYLYGANFGGPILKDKVWFYGAWGIQDIDALTLAGGSDKTWLASGYARLDAQITSGTRFNAFLQHDNKQKWGRAALDYTMQDADTLWDQEGPTYLWKAELDQMFGRDMFVNVKAIYTNGGFALHPPNDRTADGSGNYAYWSFYPSLYLSGNIVDYGTDRNQININATATYFAEEFLGGDHEFKFGVDYVSSTTTSYSLYEANTYIWDYGPGYDTPTGDWVTAWLLRDNLVNIKFTRYSAYFQDTMTFGRLAVNLGVRYDEEKSVVQDLNIPASLWLPQYMPALTIDEFDPGVKWSVLSPRLSFSYDLFGNGKDVIKLSISRYGSQSGNNMAYWINPLGFTAIQVLWQDFDQDGRMTMDELYGYDWDTGQLMDPNDPDYWLDYSNVNPDDPTAVVALNKFDPDYNSPLLDEINLSYEKELLADFTGRLELFYKKRWRQTWYKAMDAEENLDTEENFYLAGHDDTVDYDYYGRTTLFPYEYCTNHEKAFDRYLGAQLVFQKRLSNRWMFFGSFTYADWRRYYEGEWFGLITDIFYNTTLYGGPNNEEYFDGGVVAPESGGSGVQDYYVNSRWQFKLSGLYQLPFGVNFSGAFAAREGYVKPNYVLVQMPGIGNKELYGSPDGGGKFGDERLPAYWVINLRLEKVFQLSEHSSVTLAVDAFNIANSAHVLKKVYRIDTPDHDQTLRILNPRVFRFGIRFDF